MNYHFINFQKSEMKNMSEKKEELILTLKKMIQKNIVFTPSKKKEKKI